MKKLELSIQDYLDLNMSLNEVINEYIEDIDNMSLSEVMYEYNVDSKEEAVDGVIEYWTNEYNNLNK